LFGGHLLKFRGGETKDSSMGNLVAKNNFTEELATGLSFEMVYVEGGEFEMGGKDAEAYDDEKPVHSVHVPAFFLGPYPVTQELWEQIMGNNPSSFKGTTRPVEKVSWHDAHAFLEKLNAETGKNYRLPTEAEWEYAARGGVRSMGFMYAGSDKLKEVGWYGENSGGETHPVGQLLGDELGLYDMSGNVWEWCEDDWHNDYQGAPTDGSAWIARPNRGPARVLRGGGWDYYAGICRVSFRNWNEPDVRYDFIGFRLCLSPDSYRGSSVS
jgi:sulfatase modifying factor 1